jgi:hypothetical protein
MKSASLDSARECLARAKAEHANMKAADSFEKMEAAWTNFLLMSNRVYARIEQGAKGNGTSFGWYGTKKHERRKDPLLSYIKNARDADEHGIERVTGRDYGSTQVRFPEGATITSGTMSHGNIDIQLAEPRPVEVTFNGPSVKLVEVTNYGDKYQPPGNTDPVAVAELFLNHLEALIAEAAALAK